MRRWHPRDGRTTRTTWQNDTAAVRSRCARVRHIRPCDLRRAYTTVVTIASYGADMRAKIADAYADRVDKYDKYMAAFDVRLVLRKHPMHTCMHELTCCCRALCIKVFDHCQLQHTGAAQVLKAILALSERVRATTMYARAH